jgi:uncharacterized membrane protein YsdA (DUF1294 family)/cold shock CspA family protein
MRDQGRLADWNDEKGFGFVTPDQGGLRAFVHIRAFSYRTRRPRNGDLISYQLGWDAQGRPRAENVLFRETHRAGAAARSAFRLKSTVQYALAAASLVAVVALATMRKISWIFPLAYVSMSLLLFCVYALDKSAAMNRRSRTSENTLHFLSLLGGWPGGLVAQSLFHHKSTKTSYRITFFLIVGIHVALLISLALDLQHPLLGNPLFGWMLGH